MFMYTIRLEENGEGMVRKHESIRDAKLDFLAVVNYMAEEDKYPLWHRVVICRAYQRDADGKVTPMGIKLEAERYD